MPRGIQPIDMLDRIRAGEEAALALLLKREWPLLVRFLEARVGPDRAQDAAQEAFIRLWEKRESWSSGSARALLYRIGVNAATDLLRKGEARRRRAAVGDWNTAASPPTPFDVVEGDEARARFQAALEELPSRRREVFELVRRDGFTYRETAEVLGMAPQTVANHMSWALRDLREALADILPRTAAPPPDDRARSSDG